MSEIKTDTAFAPAMLTIVLMPRMRLAKLLEPKSWFARSILRFCSSYSSCAF
jgi:hypothetical protein